jgi:hypothetical protein
MKATNKPVAGGKAVRSYVTFATIFMELRALRDSEIIRSVDIGNPVSHEIRVRKSAVDSLGNQFSSAFSTDWDAIADINTMKADYYILILYSDDGLPVVEGAEIPKGRLFKIRGMRPDDEYREWIKLGVQEVEEKGSGAPV